MSKPPLSQPLRWKSMPNGWQADSFYIVPASIGIQWELQRMMPGAHCEVYGRGQLEELKELAQKLSRFEPEVRPFALRPGDPGFVAVGAAPEPKPGLLQRAATRISAALS